MEKPVAVKLDSINFSYDGVTNTINNVSFEILENEYVCIVGHNGSGKSTISKILMGLLKPKSGTIEIFNNLITYLNISYLRTNVGIIFQNPDSQFIGFTTEDDIAFGLENRKVNRIYMDDIIKNVANIIDIENELKTESHSLSGGQKQKVAISSVLAMNPKIIIFDESTSMLDPKSKTELKRIMLNLKKLANKTVISITHDMDELLQADKVIVMEKGSVAKIGSPREIFTDFEFIQSISLDFPFILNLSRLLHIEDKKVELTLDKDNLVGQLCQKKK